MSRGRKPNPINYTEEIEKVNMRITHHENSIKELEEKKEVLQEKKNQQDMVQLSAYLTEHNMSVGQLLEQLG
jgi:hypothetical protein